MYAILILSAFVFIGARKFALFQRAFGVLKISAAIRSHDGRSWR
jgi:hypothetical protein